MPENAPSRPKNIVIMVGDGMGPAYTSAYRYYQDNPDTQEIEQTVFDRLLVGNASTYPATISGTVTDSAAAATALATGIKSYNGAISVDVNKHPIATIMELAKKRGLSTGVAVTSQINHATPAAFLSHNESRRNYDELAQSYLNTDADVLLGGGQKYFPAPLIKQFEAKGYQYLSDFSQLDSLTQPKVIGLFADIQLPWAINEPEANRLSKMTQKALELLSQNDKGFVLLVEGSLIDWAGHDNDIASAMAEMNEFANALEVVEQYIRSHNDTLMVVTADHNTGGLSIGSNDQYRWDGQVLRSIKNSPEVIAKDAIAIDDWQALIASRLGSQLSPEEQQLLATARMQGQKVLHQTLKQVIDTRSNTGWTTHGHTGVDVQVFASGPASTLFYGHQDNTDIANKLISLLPKIKAVAASEVKPAQTSSSLPSVVSLETSTMVKAPAMPEDAISEKARSEKARSEAKPAVEPAASSIDDSVAELLEAPKQP
ncbi:alkaline phosphatase [Shewanella sp. Isolate11]|uniref:alkaline phosphatase n=1 Tax=Shewanella sp. Isolate11 TaxID=2908530 RepID=UPI001EFDB245|nr:alkaline phosphatase [Shewanella sp. Isolate11]MCG9695615.1 alkaline phosphatase [Shewanella sp. Isolate11]